MGSFRYSVESTSVATAALPYYQTYQIYGILKASQLYTSLEIYAYPFDELTWTFLLGSVIMGLMITYIVTQYYECSLLIRIAIGYPPLRNASLYVFRFIFGQDITLVPNTNFGRCMTAFWHVYGMLFRTAYQSLIFKLAKYHIYHEAPHTLTDLIEQQYSLVMTESTYESVQSVSRIAQGVIPVIQLQNTSEESAFFFVENQRDQNCFASVSSKDFLTYHVDKENGRDSYFILRENIFAEHITMYFSKHSILINRFNKLILNLRSMGLINFWAQENLQDIENKHEAAFSPITIDNLEGIFYIYGILHIIAICVFILELMIFKVKLIIYRKRCKYVK